MGKMFDIDDFYKRYMFHATEKAEAEFNQIIREIKKTESTSKDDSTTQSKNAKPCKFCNEYVNADDMLGTDNLITEFLDLGLLGNFKVAVNIENDSELAVYLMDNFYTKANFSTPIKYCPICGRKLNTSHSEDEGGNI